MARDFATKLQAAGQDILDEARAAAVAAGTGVLILGTDGRTPLVFMPIWLGFSGGKAAREPARKVNYYSETKRGDPKAVSLS